ncbi:conserved hypothetical protein [Aspergillus udagawae]|nr:conserved hypothetical protein [Aspergillus udagawae]
MEGAWSRNDDLDWHYLESLAGQAEGVFNFQEFDPKFKTVPDTIQWLTVLGSLATEKAFWWLVEASRIEKDTQYRLVANVFKPSRRHRAWYTPAKTESLRDSFFVHIKLQAVEAEEARTYVKTDLNQKGVAVETHSSGDLVLLVKGDIPQHREVEIVTVVKPNTMPIVEQIKALGEVSLCRSWGELEGKEGGVFLLKRTVLAHGVELDPISDFYFLLDARKMSKILPQQQAERISYMAENPPLGLFSGGVANLFASDLQPISLHKSELTAQTPINAGWERQERELSKLGPRSGCCSRASTAAERDMFKIYNYISYAYYLRRDLFGPTLLAGVQVQSQTFLARRAWVALPQCASYSQAPQSLPPRPPLPGLSAAPPQDEEEAGHEEVEMMEDFRDQRAPSEPRDHDESALQLYRERERSHSPEHIDLSIERGYRDRRSPGRDVAMRAAYYVEGDDVQALRRQSNEMRLRSMIAREERLRAQEEREIFEARLAEERLRSLERNGRGR